MLDAMGYVIAQHLFLDTPKSCADGRNLRHDVDAVPPLLHHFGEAANLTFNAVQALQTGGFGFFLHALTYTLWGYICQAEDDGFGAPARA